MGKLDFFVKVRKDFQSYIDPGPNPGSVADPLCAETTDFLFWTLHLLINGMGIKTHHLERKDPEERPWAFE